MPQRRKRRKNAGSTNVPVRMRSAPVSRPVSPQPRHLPADSRSHHGLQVSLTREEHFSYPLPPPEVLSRYDRVIDNGAERIFEWIHGQSAHRQRHEAKVINANIVAMFGGLIAATVIVLYALRVARDIARSGSDLTAFATVVSALAILAGVYYTGARAARRERIDKAKIMAGQDPDQG